MTIMIIKDSIPIDNYKSVPQSYPAYQFPNQGSLPAQQRPPRGFSETASEHKFKPAIVRFPDNTTVQ